MQALQKGDKHKDPEVTKIKGRTVICPSQMARPPFTAFGADDGGERAQASPSDNDRWTEGSVRSWTSRPCSSNCQVSSTGQRDAGDGSR